MVNNLVIAQISDSHLFADCDGLHHQADVYQNLVNVLTDIKQQSLVDVIVFTGDLTQDHSDESYQLFVKAFQVCGITTPVYFVAGNHDEPALLSRYLSQAPFKQDKIIETAHWQVVLVESKSATPAGVFSKAQSNIARSKIKPMKSQLLLMHHHAVDAGFFIDLHGLENKVDFQQFLNQHRTIKAIGCGHIHQALTLPVLLSDRTINLYTCPATSIQFDMNSTTVKSNGQPPGYRIYTLAENQEVTSKVVFV